MIIDGHAHACGIYLTEESILENLKIQGIDKIILSPGEHNSSKNYSLPDLGKLFKSSQLIYWNNKLTSEIIKRSNEVKFLDEENERIACLAEKHPHKIMNTYWVNVSKASCIEKLKKFREKHDFTMIKMHQCWTPFKMRDTQCLEVIKLAAEINKPVFIHLSSQEQVREFISVALEYPDTTFIVAHLIGIEEFDKKLKLNNIYFDLSCPELHSINMLKKAYDLAGAKRILLGSDSPYGKNNIKKVVRQLEVLQLSAQEMQWICGMNIEDMLNR